MQLFSVFYWKSLSKLKKLHQCLTKTKNFILIRIYFCFTVLLTCHGTDNLILIISIILNAVWVHNLLCLSFLKTLCALSLWFVSQTRVAQSKKQGQSCKILCLFNLKVCDITQESQGGISCHWGGASTFPLPGHKHRTWFTQWIFICVSQMVKHNILTASSSRVSEGRKKRPRCILAKISKPWLSEIGLFEGMPT